jgi:hypothetical protein
VAAAGGVHVRRAIEGDVAAVLRVDHVTERADEVRHAVEDSRCLVAEIGGHFVGFCIGGRFFGFDFLELLVVRASDRRQGFGTARLPLGRRRRSRGSCSRRPTSRTLPCSACANAWGTLGAESSRTWTSAIPRSSTSRSTAAFKHDGCSIRRDASGDGEAADRGRAPSYAIARVSMTSD